MQHSLTARRRPGGVKVLAALLAIGSVFMALLGWSASAYYVPALCLLFLAALLWTGRGHRLLKWVVILNLVSGSILVLVLWLGDGLGARKLDVSGAMLLVNLLCGGPLASLLGGALLWALRPGHPVSGWFGLRRP